MDIGNLNPRLIEILSDHLEAEESYLLRLKCLAEKLTSSGGQVPPLAEHQSELSALVGEMLELQLRRNAIREAAGKLSGTDPAHFRVSNIRLPSPEAEESLQKRRRELQSLAVTTQATVSTAEATLKGWAGIVNSVLSELLDPTSQCDRYTASGHRLTRVPDCPVDVRS
jgi:hypothetical protein